MIYFFYLFNRRNTTIDTIINSMPSYFDKIETNSKNINAWAQLFYSLALLKDSEHGEIMAHSIELLVNNKEMVSTKGWAYFLSGSIIANQPRKEYFALVEEHLEKIAEVNSENIQSICMCLVSFHQVGILEHLECLKPLGEKIEKYLLSQEKINLEAFTAYKWCFSTTNEELCSKAIATAMKNKFMKLSLSGCGLLTQAYPGFEALLPRAKQYEIENEKYNLQQMKYLCGRNLHTALHEILKFNQEMYKKFQWVENPTVGTHYSAALYSKPYSLCFLFEYPRDEILQGNTTQFKIKYQQISDAKCNIIKLNASEFIQLLSEPLEKAYSVLHPLLLQYSSQIFL